MTHPSRKKLAGSVFTMGYAMFLVQFGSVSTVYCLRCLFRCCRYMLFLLLTGLFLLLAPFSLKQPNPVFADCLHLLHQNLNISWETLRNTSLEKPDLKQKLQSPPSGASWGGHQWCLPRRGQEHSGGGLLLLPQVTLNQVEVERFENAFGEPVHEPQEIVCHQAAWYALVQPSVPEQLVLDLKAKKHLLPFNLGVTETRIGCINHDLEDGRNQPNYVW